MVRPSYFSTGYGLIGSPFHHSRSGAQAEDREVQVWRVW